MSRTYSFPPTAYDEALKDLFPELGEIGNLPVGVSAKDGGQVPPPFSNAPLSYPDLIGYSYNEQNLLQKRRSDAIEANRLDYSRQANALKDALPPKEKAFKPHSCVVSVLSAHCETGHSFMLPVYCGKQSCPYCGQDGSFAHKKRIAEVLPNVLKWSGVGFTYSVLTMPFELRNYYKSKNSLNEWRKYIQRYLKRSGVKNAVLYWHYSGDCKFCKGSKDGCPNCEYTKCSPDYHPHLNILFPVQSNSVIYEKGKCLMRQDWIDTLKSDFENWLYDRHKNKYKRGSITANYYSNFVLPVGSFDRKTGRRVTAKDFKIRARHKVKYITRATLRHPDLVASLGDALKGNKHLSRIGQWIKAKAEKGLPSCCPLCKKPLSFYPGLKEDFNTYKHKLVHVGGGWFFVDHSIPDFSWHPN